MNPPDRRARVDGVAGRPRRDVGQRLGRPRGRVASALLVVARVGYLRVLLEDHQVTGNTEIRNDEGRDLGSCGPDGPCGLEPPPSHQYFSGLFGF